MPSKIWLYGIVLCCLAAGLAIEGRQAQTRSVIAFASTRDDPVTDPSATQQRVWAATEIYVMDERGTVVRLTRNTVADAFPVLSPDGASIVFESTRRQVAGDAPNISDLFLMNSDGTDQRFLIHGSSPTWSPDGRRIAFHASASGTGQPIKIDPGAATTDSDIFIIDVPASGTNTPARRNLTNNPAAVDDDPDWSPDGRSIVFTSHAIGDDPINSSTAEIFVINADGSGKPVRLTNNAEEERAPAWSPDGKRIAFCCRGGGPDLEICVMNANGTGRVVLTDNTVGDLTPSWSPDGTRIVFHRRVGGPGQFQLFEIHADGTGEKQLTFPPGFSAFPNWGMQRRAEGKGQRSKGKGQR